MTTVTLAGCDYALCWLTPEQSGGPWPLPRSTGDGDYGDHVGPLYNLHCDLVAGVNEPAGQPWSLFWRELAAGLGRQVDRFGLVATSAGRLAGKVRFYPKTLTVPRWIGWPPGEHRRDWTADVLWIGGAYVDPLGAGHGLDGELLRRAVEHGRQAGYQRIQAVACAAVPPYARWSETFPEPLYEALGFWLIGRGEGSPDAVAHMLEGCHGPADREVARASIAAGVDPDTAAQGRVMELDLAGPRAPSPAVPPLAGVTTPLHVAAAEGSEDTVRFLLDHGADADAEDAQGRTPRSLATGEEVQRLLSG